MILPFFRASIADCTAALCGVYNINWQRETLNAKSESGKPLVGNYWIANVPTQPAQLHERAPLTSALHALKSAGLIPEGKASDYLCIDTQGRRYLALPEIIVRQYVRKRAKLVAAQKEAAQVIPEVAAQAGDAIPQTYEGSWAPTQPMAFDSEVFKPVMLTEAHYRIVPLLDKLTHHCQFQGQPAGWSLCEHSGGFHLLTDDRKAATHILRAHGIAHEAHTHGDMAIIEVPFSENLEHTLQASTSKTPDTVVGSVHVPIKLHLPDAAAATTVVGYLARG